MTEHKMATEKVGKSGDPVVGIVGGGQLGCMLADAADELSVNVVVSDTDTAAPAKQQRAEFIGAASWPVAIDATAAASTVLTWDREDVPMTSLDGVAVAVPARESLRQVQDRLQQKQTYDSLGLPTAAWMGVETTTSVAEIVQQIGLPLVLKARHGGFDGRGTIFVDTAEKLHDALVDLPIAGVIAEQAIHFDDEGAVTVARRANGDVVIYDPVLTTQFEGQLAWALAPHPEHQRVGKAMQDIAQRLAVGIDYVGAMTVEFFRCGDQVLINEVAPRVHNSAHWTIEGAETSQFTNHILALIDAPLQSPALKGASLLLNCLGAMPEKSLADGSHAGAPVLHYHDYGKAPRPLRKVGHLTMTASGPAELAVQWPTVPAPLRQLFPDLDAAMATYGASMSEG